MFLADIPLNIDWQQILLHLLNFVILVGGLYLLLFGPIKKFILKRKAYYENLDKEANAKLENASLKEKEAEQRMLNLEDEIETKKVEAVKELNDLKSNYKKDAEKESEEIIKAANKEAKRVKEQALKDANKEIEALAIDASRKLAFAKSLDEAYDSFLNQDDGDNNGK